MVETFLNDADGRRDTRRDTVTILIEARSLTRQCLSAWLEQREPEGRLFALATPFAGFDAGGASVDLVIWSIGGASVCSGRVRKGLERLKERFSEAPIAVLADLEDPACIREAIRQGVKGYVPTSLDRGEAIEVLRFLKAGGTYVPASVLTGMDKDERSKQGALKQGAGLADDQAPLHCFDGLTPRETDVVDRLRQGKPNKVIAHELDISESTVKVFVHRILHKLGAVNRTEVAYLAQQHEDRNDARSETVV